MEVELQDWETQQCPPLPRDSADRGGVSKKTEGFERNQRCSFVKLAEKPLRGCGSTPSARKRATSPIALQTEEDIAGSGLWFMVEGWEQWNRGKWKN